MKRRAFTLIEITLVLVIFGILTLIAIKWANKTADDAMIKQEYLNAYRFEMGMKNSFIAILDTFEGVCGVIPSDGTASMGWGWGNAGCANTSPLPRKAGNTIVYDINLGNLSAGMQASLKNQIVAAYAPMCSISGSTATSLTLYCGTTLTNMQYDTTSGLVGQYHTPGTNFNMIDTPVPVLTLTRTYMEGSGSDTKQYRLNLSDVFGQRLAYSTAKMESVGKMLKNIYNMKLARETSNTSPVGLNSVDDELIPWYWTAFGDDAGLAATTVCAKNAVTGVCDNLNANTIWRATAGDAEIWRRLIPGLAAGDYKYTVDGFGNALRIYPILSQCAGTNLALCTVTAPSVPKAVYPIAATLKPPYVAIIYNGVSSGGVNCADTSTQSPMGCRYPIVF